MAEPSSRAHDHVARHLDVIERITGHRPPTCPWQAFYDPLVREVLQVTWAVEGGNLAVAVGDDPPAILIDAIGVYMRALTATRNEDEKLRAQAESQRIKQAMAEGKGRG